MAAHSSPDDPLTDSAANQTEPVTVVPTPVEPIYVESRFEHWIRHRWRQPFWLVPFLILSCLAVGSGYVLANNPTDEHVDPLGSCAFKTLTGYDCPGCGGTRMVWYLLHGDILEAGRHHFVAFLAIPFLIYAYTVMVAGRFFRIKLPTMQLPVSLGICYMVFWALYAVARNLPWAPFNVFYV